MEGAIQKYSRLITVPIFLLMIYTVFTFLPILYTYMPFWGQMRIVLVAGSGLLLTYIITSGSYNNIDAWKNPIFYALAGFIMVAYLGLIVSLDRGATLIISNATIKHIVVIAIMIKIIDSRKRLDLIMKTYIACGVGMALSTIINEFQGETFQQSIRVTAIDSGIMADPNDLALFLNSTIPFLLYYFVTVKRKIIPLIGIIAVILAIMLTYSRGGFLGMAATGIGFVLISGTKAKRYAAVVLIGAILFWLGAPGEYKERLSTIKTEARIDEATGKYPGRMQAWVELLPKGMESPLLGVGAGNSYYLAGKYIKDWHAMHNSFLQAFLEVGLFGFICYAALYFLPHRQYRRFKTYKNEEIISDISRYKFLLLSLTCYAISAFFLPQAYSPILFFISALALIQSELISRKLTKLQEA